MERISVIAFGAFLACCPCASALNPSLDIYPGLARHDVHTLYEDRERTVMGCRSVRAALG
jgi:hypothetical protein